MNLTNNSIKLLQAETLEKETLIVKEKCGNKKSSFYCQAYSLDKRKFIKVSATIKYF